MHQMKHRQMLRSLVGCDPQALWNVNLIIYTLFKLPGLPPPHPPNPSNSGRGLNIRSSVNVQRL